MFDHILVPLDGSEFGESALPHAVELAKKFDAKITLVRILESVSTLFAVEDPALFQDIRYASAGQAERYLNEVKQRFDDQDVEIGIHYTDKSDVAGAIIDSIEDLKADMIAMSTHGRTGIDRWMFGSIAEKVLRHAPVPVLLIRPETEPNKLELAHD